LNAIEPFPYPQNFGGATTPFAAKIDPSGTKLIYATLIGGMEGTPGGIAIDSSGDAYVTGGYSAIDGPAFTFPGVAGKPMGGAFLVKLDPNGKLLLSVLFGGSSGNDAGTAIALDASNSVYISGNAASQDFPVTSGSTPSGALDIFLTKLDGTTGKILYSTLLGPGDSPQMTLGSQGDLFIAANTTSAAWPVTSGALQPHCAGTTCADVIALRFRPSTSQTVYATYLGGTGKDQIGGVAADAGGSLYISGTTTSSDFPVTGTGFSEPCAGVLPPNCGSKAFVARLNPSGTSLKYATYLGGNAVDRAWNCNRWGRQRLCHRTNDICEFPGVARYSADNHSGPMLQSAYNRRLFLWRGWFPDHS
jgi:Beta-propeller repeat